jgi:hypothetical protein
VVGKGVWKPLVLIALVALSYWGLSSWRYAAGHTDGEADANRVWQAKWDEEATRLATARTKAEQEARSEEQRRQAEIDGVRDHAQQEISRARDDAAVAGIESGRLREQARRLAARASQCASNTSTAQGSPSATEPAMVLADLLSRADERAGELAAAYDRARTAGLACERTYLALTRQK